MSKYSDRSKEYTLQYMKDKLQRVEVRFQKDDFEKRIGPAIERSGEPVATFIKNAVDERIARLGLEEDN